jgi:hypothetical protein
LATFSDVYIYVDYVVNTDCIVASIHLLYTQNSNSTVFLTSKKMLEYSKITTSLQKDYNYNQIDRYLAWPTSFISVCNLIWGLDCHVTFSYREVKIIKNHNLELYICSKIYIIDHNPSWKENQRQNRESFWIRELQTLQPEGINKKTLSPTYCDPQTWQSRR